MLNSAVCCIYHRPKAVDESSDESSSDSSSSDSDSEPSGAKPVGGKRDCGHDHGRRERGRGSKKGKEKRTPSPNAYEMIPKVKPKDEDGGKTA